MGYVIRIAWLELAQCGKRVHTLLKWFLLRPYNAEDLQEAAALYTGHFLYLSQQRQAIRREVGCPEN
jgi:hypothetical protein